MFLPLTFSGYKTRLSKCMKVRTEEGPEPARITTHTNMKLAPSQGYRNLPLLAPEELLVASSPAQLHRAAHHW